MNQPIDVFWVLLCAILVFVMQAGFLMLEAGFTRNKNNINVAMKNIADFALSTLVFWAIGYGLMFGLNHNGLLGLSDFFPEIESDKLEKIAFFAFQVMFCGTAVTIVSGAIAERVRFSAYIVIAIVVAAIIYPIFGHWAWNGIELARTTGWLNQMGFVDFAGSTVVHSVGGWISLAILLIIGARNGRYDAKGKPQKVPASNLPTATIGVMLLWFGWFGFNGGSALAFNEVAIRALINTIIAGSAGLTAGYLLSLILYRYVDVGLLLNGTLAGLVGITANAHAVSIVSSILIGGIAVLVMYAAQELLDRLHIDDAVGAVPVHLAAGIWGTLAVGIFGDLTLLGTGLGRFEQIGVQALGIVTCALWTFSTSYALSFAVNLVTKIRVSAEVEHLGLNISEHKARTDMLDLFDAMDEQAHTGDLSMRIPVEPFTETGRIADRYNRVMSSLQQVSARADAIIRSVNDAIITFSAHEYRIFSTNPATESIFGYTLPQLQHKSFFVLLPSIPNFDAMASFVQELSAYDGLAEVTALRATGESFLAELSIAYFEQDESGFYTATFRDISQRKQLEQERQKMRELELKSEMAFENSRLKSEFLSSVTHELRTPLNSLLGYTGLLLMGVRGEIDKDARDVIGNMEESSRQLLALVNDILDLDKIESGQFRLTNNPIDVRRYVRKWSEQVQVLAQQKDLRLETEIAANFPNIIWGDGDRLTQIALNLLSNAIKFTEKGSVRLKLGFHKNAWTLEVIDTGIGIADTDKAIIFEKFRQVDGSYTRKHGGTGLGLAIVEQLVLAMGGKIEVESRPQLGSSFSVTLPVILA